MYKKNLIVIFFMVQIGCFSCNTPKDPAPPVPVFEASDLVGKWELVAGAADIGGGAIVIPNIFDRTNLLLQSDTTGFCSQNAVLELLTGIRFQETSNCYQTFPNKTLAGIYTFNQSAASFVLTYNEEAKITPRNYRITELTTNTMKVSYSDTRQGVVFLSKLTYQKR
jgi:hypothetical protein